MIRTDKPEAEIYLNDKHITWEAHRELSDTILLKIQDILKQQNLSYSDLRGIGVYAGPGSFTGLRIGVTIANTMAYALDIPVVGTKGETWIDEALMRLTKEENDIIVKPFYGRDARITQPRK